MQRRGDRRAALAGGVVWLALTGSALAQQATPAPTAGASQANAGKAQDNYDALFQRRLNDLVTIRVSEVISAQGSADSSLDKSSQGSATLPSFFGLESKVPSFLNPAQLAQLGADTSFKGGGSTTRSGTLQAVITARVAEVFPNGDLGIEGVREIDINGDRQIIVVTGVVRQVDVMPGNVVPSTAIGQMRIRYFGRGLIKDNLNPGWLVRVLNKIF
jgi:flagellar L-ring protein FlgH